MSFEVFALGHAGLWRDVGLGKPVDWAKIYAPEGGVPPGKGKLVSGETPFLRFVSPFLLFRFHERF